MKKSNPIKTICVTVIIALFVSISVAASGLDYSLTQGDISLAFLFDKQGKEINLSDEQLLSKIPEGTIVMSGDTESIFFESAVGTIAVHNDSLLIFESLDPNHLRFTVSDGSVSFLMNENFVGDLTVTTPSSTYYMTSPGELRVVTEKNEEVAYIFEGEVCTTCQIRPEVFITYDTPATVNMRSYVPQVTPMTEEDYHKLSIRPYSVQKPAGTTKPATSGTTQEPETQTPASSQQTGTTTTPETTTGTTQQTGEPTTPVTTPEGTQQSGQTTEPTTEPTETTPTTSPEGQTGTTPATPEAPTVVVNVVPNFTDIDVGFVPYQPTWANVTISITPDAEPTEGVVSGLLDSAHTVQPAIPYLAAPPIAPLFTNVTVTQDNVTYTDATMAIPKIYEPTFLFEGYANIPAPRIFDPVITFDSVPAKPTFLEGTPSITFDQAQEVAVVSDEPKFLEDTPIISIDAVPEKPEFIESPDEPEFSEDTPIVLAETAEEAIVSPDEPEFTGDATQVTEEQTTTQPLITDSGETQRKGFGGGVELSVGMHIVPTAMQTQLAMTSEAPVVLGMIKPYITYNNFRLALRASILYGAPWNDTVLFSPVIQLSDNILNTAGPLAIVGSSLQFIDELSFGTKSSAVQFIMDTKTPISFTNPLFLNGGISHEFDDNTLQKNLIAYGYGAIATRTSLFSTSSKLGMYMTIRSIPFVDYEFYFDDAYLTNLLYATAGLSANTWQHFGLRMGMVPISSYKGSLGIGVQVGFSADELLPTKWNIYPSVDLHLPILSNTVALDLNILARTFLSVSPFDFSTVYDSTGTDFLTKFPNFVGAASLDFSSKYVDASVAFAMNNGAITLNLFNNTEFSGNLASLIPGYTGSSYQISAALGLTFGGFFMNASWEGYFSTADFSFINDIGAMNLGYTHKNFSIALGLQVLQPTVTFTTLFGGVFADELILLLANMNAVQPYLQASVTFDWFNLDAKVMPYSDGTKVFFPLTVGATFRLGTK